MEIHFSLQLLVSLNDLKLLPLAYSFDNVSLQPLIDKVCENAYCDAARSNILRLFWPHIAWGKLKIMLPEKSQNIERYIEWTN